MTSAERSIGGPQDDGPGGVAGRAAGEQADTPVAAGVLGDKLGDAAGAGLVRGWPGTRSSVARTSATDALGASTARPPEPELLRELQRRFETQGRRIADALGSEARDALVAGLRRLTEPPET